MNFSIEQFKKATNRLLLVFLNSVHFLKDSLDKLVKKFRGK